MSKATPPLHHATDPRLTRLVPWVVLALALIAYANNFRHDYFLDDSYFITDNTFLRSLANIPRYFVDPGTFATYRANVDYRPILSTSWAINYWMAGGYSTPWWHLTQVLLHVSVALGLAALTRRVISMIPGWADDTTLTWLAPTLVATVFVVHPTASGVVNYMSARSSLLTAAFLVPAMVSYVVPREDPRWRAIPWSATVLLAAAFWTKVETVGVLGAFVAFELWQVARLNKSRRGMFGDLGAMLDPAILRRLAAPLVVTAIYFVVRSQLMAPFEFELTRRASGITNQQYFWTQLVVWWEYLRNWFVPVGLVADDAVHPIFTGPGQGPVFVALVSWVLIGVALVRQWRTRPWLVFIAIAALALLSPTSSISPLAEMRNEHRPYLPLGVLSIAWCLPATALLLRLVRHRPARRRIAVTAAATVVALLMVLTWNRNKAFSTSEAYLRDVIEKAPASRSLNNLGLIHMNRGEVAEALRLFEQAETLAPAWWVVQVNLAQAHRALGDSARADRYMDRAVDLDAYSGSALTWRAETRLQRRDYAGALTDLERAKSRSTDVFVIQRGLATALAGLGRADEAADAFEIAFRSDPERTGIEIVRIAAPFFADSAHARAGVQFFERVVRTAPNAWWAYANLASLATWTGDTARAAAARAEAERLRSQ